MDYLDILKEGEMLKRMVDDLLGRPVQLKMREKRWRLEELQEHGASTSPISCLHHGAQ